MSPKLVLILLAARLFAQSAGVEKAILDVHTQMTRAAEARDVDAMFRFILPNERGSIVQSGFLFLSRDDAQASVKSNFSAVERVQYRWKHQMVTVISADCALLVADGESEATFNDGRSATAPFAQSVVFVRKDGEWKVLHAHYSSGPRR
jgi:ketosteroid isomerase-like protein